METHDRRIVYARQILTEARKRDVAELPLAALMQEDKELRRVLGWALDVVDDYADTELDEDVTQVTLSGGVYVAPADVMALCGPCLNRLLTDEGNGSLPAPQTTQTGQHQAIPVLLCESSERSRSRITG